MARAIVNLLDEVSWEGTTAPYRGGGRGRENVLTAEVWQALDLLPRTAFLGAVLDSIHPVTLTDCTPSSAVVSCREAISYSTPTLELEVLCGDRVSTIGPTRVQPDVLLEDDESIVFVEAKRIRGGSFQPEQIARNLLVLEQLRGSRTALLLLVIGTPPPVRVSKAGLMSVQEAAGDGLSAMRLRDPRVPAPGALASSVAWIT